MSAVLSNPSLASQVGTRVDSAAKHNVAVRVSSALMACWCDDPANARNKIHQQKEKYAMFKNELVLNVSQSLNECGTIISSAKAYPHVVSNLGDMTTTTKNLLCILYHRSISGYDWMNFKNYIHSICMNNDPRMLTDLGIVVDTDNVDRSMREIKDLPYFTAMGYALTQAFACDLSGDTVGTVLIGGMQTVLNGAFEIRAGERVQWYFDFEEDFFYKQTTEDPNTKTRHLAGSRKITDKQLPDDIRNHNKYEKSVSQQNRENWNALQLGAVDGFPKNHVKKNIILPKPLKQLSNGGDHYADKIRVFALCINGGRPGDAIDIMMMTQCM